MFDFLDMLAVQESDRWVTISLKKRDVEYYVAVSYSEAEIGLAVNQLRQLVNCASTVDSQTCFLREKISLVINTEHFIARFRNDVPWAWPLIEKGQNIGCCHGHLNEYLWVCARTIKFGVCCGW